MCLDLSHEKINLETLNLLLDLAAKRNLKQKINAMISGVNNNFNYYL